MPERSDASFRYLRLLPRSMANSMDFEANREKKSSTLRRGKRNRSDKLKRKQQKQLGRPKSK